MPFSIDCYNPLNAIITDDCLQVIFPSSHHKIQKQKTTLKIQIVKKPANTFDDVDDGVQWIKKPMV